MKKILILLIITVLLSSSVMAATIVGEDYIQTDNISSDNGFEINFLNATKFFQGIGFNNSDVKIGNNVTTDIYSEDVILIGKDINASGAQDSIIIGRNIYSQADEAITIGIGATTNGNVPVAIGKESYARDGGTSIGTLTQTGATSVAIGYSANTVGLGNSNAVAIGSYSEATGPRSFALGYKANASASASVAIGSNTVNTVANSFKLGGDLTDAYFEGVSLNLIDFDSKGSNIIYVNNSDSKEFIVDKDINLITNGTIISEGYIQTNDGWLGVNNNGGSAYIELSTDDWTTGASIGLDTSGDLRITSNYSGGNYFIMDSLGVISLPRNLSVTNNIDSASYSAGGTPGWSGTCNASQNITVVNGIVTGCV